MSDLTLTAPPVTTRFILDALRHRHGKQGYAEVFFEELRVGSGYGPSSEGRIDAWAMELWPSSGLKRTAYEVKVSRGDFLRELKQPLKRRRALLFSNLYYFVAPAGLLKPADLPPEAGLLEVSPDGLCKVVVQAIERETVAPTWRFVASIARRIAGLEQGLTPP